MQVDPTTSINLNNCTLRTSKKSATGLKTETFKRHKHSFVHYMGKGWRRLRHPCTRMDKVWGKMHSHARLVWERPDSSVNKLEKLRNIETNLRSFEKEVIGRHNSRRFKLMVKMHLAGVRIKQKDVKYRQITDYADEVIRSWSVGMGRSESHRRARISTKSMDSLYGSIKEMRLIRQHALEIYGLAGVKPTIMFFNFGINFTASELTRDEYAVILIEDCRHKLAGLISLWGQPAFSAGPSAAARQEMRNELLQLYGVERTTDLPQSVQDALAQLGAQEEIYDLLAATHRVGTENHTVQQLLRRHAQDSYTLRRYAARMAVATYRDQIPAIQTALNEAATAIKERREINIAGLPDIFRRVYFNMVTPENWDRLEAAEQYIKSLAHPDEEIPNRQNEFNAILDDMFMLAAGAEVLDGDAKTLVELIVRSHLLGFKPDEGQCPVMNTWADETFERTTAGRKYEYYAPNVVEPDCARQHRLNPTLSVLSPAGRVSLRFTPQPDGTVVVHDKEPIPQEILDFLNDWRAFFDIAD